MIQVIYLSLALSLLLILLLFLLLYLSLYLEHRFPSINFVNLSFIRLFRNTVFHVLRFSFLLLVD